VELGRGCTPCRDHFQVLIKRHVDAGSSALLCVSNWYPSDVSVQRIKLHNTVSDNVSFLWSRLVDSKFGIQEAEYVLQKEEFQPIELHI
jgi:hypothetical protein